MQHNLMQLSGIDLVVPTHGLEGANAQQTQTILNTLGRFVAWAGSGSQTASTSQG